MRNGMLGSLTAVLLCTSVGIAQVNPAALGAPESAVQAGKEPARQTPQAVLLAPESPPTQPSLFNVGRSPSSDMWGDTTFLLWRFSRAPIPVPLVTTGDPGDFGILTNPSTQILAGNRNHSSGYQTGFQLTVGRWFTDDAITGLEASGFYFTPKGSTPFAGAAVDGTTILAVPFVNTTPGGTSGAVPGSPLTGGFFPPFVKTANGQSAIPLAGGANRLFGQGGGAVVTTYTTFWGAEINGVLNLRRTENSQVNLLIGFRYIDLAENLNLDTTSSFVAPITVGPLWNFTTHDHFGTRNQLFMGQLGLKVERTAGVFFVNAVGKLAMGASHEVVDINGRFSDPTPLLLSAWGAGSTGGLFTAQTNSGTRSHGQFVVVPEIGIRGGINLTNNIRVFAGYDAMYISSVVRPGTQMDRNINLTQVGATFGFPGTVPTLVGPPNPAPQFNQSSFWAQGATFGLEFRY